MGKTDEVKSWIAAEVAAATSLFERRGINQENVDHVTVSRVSNLESQVRVVLKQGGVRYFSVKVSEHL